MNDRMAPNPGPDRPNPQVRKRAGNETRHQDKESLWASLPIPTHFVCLPLWERRDTLAPYADKYEDLKASIREWKTSMRELITECKKTCRDMIDVDEDIVHLTVTVLNLPSKKCPECEKVIAATVEELIRVMPDQVRPPKELVISSCAIMKTGRLLTVHTSPYVEKVVDGRTELELAAPYLHPLFRYIVKGLLEQADNLAPFLTPEQLSVYKDRLRFEGSRDAAVHISLLRRVRPAALAGYKIEELKPAKVRDLSIAFCHCGVQNKYPEKFRSLPL